MNTDSRWRWLFFFFFFFGLVTSLYRLCFSGCVHPRACPCAPVRGIMHWHEYAYLPPCWRDGGGCVVVGGGEQADSAFVIAAPPHSLISHNAVSPLCLLHLSQLNPPPLGQLKHKCRARLSLRPPPKKTESSLIIDSRQFS